MEKLIQELEKELKEMIEGKILPTKRKELGDLVDLRFLRMVNFSLQWTSVGYQSALRLAGMKLGKRLGGNSERRELLSVLEEIKTIIEGLKIGKVEIKTSSGVKNIEFKIYHSALTIEVPTIFQKLCFFEEGFIEGYLDGAISKTGALTVREEAITVSKVRVEEKRCVGLGDDCCLFLIKFLE